jgi:hypothetical protein
VLDNLGREAVAAVAERTHAAILSDTRLAPEPVFVTMPGLEFVPRARAFSDHRPSPGISNPIAQAGSESRG